MLSNKSSDFCLILGRLEKIRIGITTRELIFCKNVFVLENHQKSYDFMDSKLKIICFLII